MSLVMLHFLLHTVLVNIEWLDQLTLKYKIVTFMRWYRNRQILCTALVFFSMWPNTMNIFVCNMWQLSATRYSNRMRVSTLIHGIEKFVIWFTVHIICFAFATPWIYLGILLDLQMQSWSCYPPSNHEMQILLYCKIRY